MTNRYIYYKEEAKGFYCQLCENKKGFKEDTIRRHIKGKKHLKKLKELLAEVKETQKFHQNKRYYKVKEEIDKITCKDTSKIILDYFGNSFERSKLDIQLKQKIPLKNPNIVFRYLLEQGLERDDMFFTTHQNSFRNKYIEFSYTNIVCEKYVIIQFNIIRQRRIERLTAFYKEGQDFEVEQEFL